MSTLNRKFLGMYLKHQRLIRGASAQALAKHIGKSTTYYYDLEKGKINNCAASIKLLFAFYGIKYTNDRFK